MAYAMDSFVAARRGVFDRLIMDVDNRAKNAAASDTDGLIVMPAAEKIETDRDAQDWILRNNCLTGEIAEAQSWKLIGNGLRHLRDHFYIVATEESVARAARKASMRNADFVQGFFVPPPELPEIKGVNPSLRDPESHARELSAVMMDVAESDVPGSRIAIATAMAGKVWRARMPEGRLDEFKGEVRTLADLHRAIGLKIARPSNLIRQATLVPAAETGVPRQTRQVMRYQTEASLELLHGSYMKVCRDFRSLFSLGPSRAPAPASSGAAPSGMN